MTLHALAFVLALQQRAAAGQAPQIDRLVVHPANGSTLILASKR
jgi:hypothetical protein